MTMHMSRRNTNFIFYIALMMPISIAFQWTYNVGQFYEIQSEHKVSMLYLKQNK